MKLYDTLNDALYDGAKQTGNNCKARLRNPAGIRDMRACMVDIHGHISYAAFEWHEDDHLYFTLTIFDKPTKQPRYEH
jgi:hypothetical protein